MPSDQKLEDVSVRSESTGLSVRRLVAPRNLLFVLLIAGSAFAGFTPLRNLVSLSMSSAEYSYLGLIPLIVLGLLYLERKQIFHYLDYCLGVGAPLILAGVGIAIGGSLLSRQLSADSGLSVEILGLVAIWIGSFVLCYGKEASRAGLFTLLFMLLLVPLPPVLMAKPIAVIQHCSTDVAAFLFALFSLPVYRQGLAFSLPKLTFVVAKECSGIHSSTALFIATILVGHFYFKAAWKKAVLVPLVFPIIAFTNGLRIFILATLSVYVDMAFFKSDLHKKGGIVFFALALVILALVTKLLRGRRLSRMPNPPAVRVAQTSSGNFLRIEEK